MKAHLVFLEFYEELVLLHFKAYQEPPINNEVNTTFAKGLDVETSKASSITSDKINYRISWATYA